VTSEESIRAAVKQRCLYYYKIFVVMSDRASTTPLSTISYIQPPEIIDCEVSGMVDDNKPVAVGTPSIKQTAEDVPIFKKKQRSSPSSFSSDLTELSQLKREHIHNVTRFKDKQCDIEERKLDLLEKRISD